MSGSITNHGLVNKYRGAVTFDSFSQLNVTAPYLTMEGIVMNFPGNATAMLPVMTGLVTSQELYVGGEMVIHLVKTMPLAALFQQQFLLNSLLGRATVRPDTPPNIGITSWQVQNTAIISVGDQSYAGSSADFPVRISGYIVVNTALFQ